MRYILIFFFILVSSFPITEADQFEKVEQFIQNNNIVVNNYYARLNNEQVDTGSSMYIQVRKNTNGGYLYSIPTVEYLYIKDQFLFNPVLNLYFSVPRGAMKSLNHHSIDLNTNLGYVKYNYFTSFSIGFQYYFDENDDKEKEGFRFYNDLKIGIFF